jgi:antitoxin component YwqK of YwqJK toxin-antitoxin module
MRFLFLALLIPLGLLSQRADTVIEGKRFKYYSSYERTDSIVVYEYCESIRKEHDANGEYRAYTTSGILVETGQFRNRRKKGTWITYFLDGKKECEGSYRIGWAIGNWTWYHSNGAVKGTARYVHKRIFQKKKIPSIAQTQFWTPKRYYPWFEIQIHSIAVDSIVEYYPNSQVKVRTRLDNAGRDIDSTEFFYPTGQVNCVQYWSGNYGTGCWKYFCPDGSLSHYENNTGTDTIQCPIPDGIYSECDYYHITLDLDWYKGRVRAKF